MNLSWTDVLNRIIRGWRCTLHQYGFCGRKIKFGYSPSIWIRGLEVTSLSHYDITDLNRETRWRTIFTQFTQAQLFLFFPSFRFNYWRRQRQRGEKLFAAGYFFVLLLLVRSEIAITHYGSLWRVCRIVCWRWKFCVNLAIYIRN